MSEPDPAVRRFLLIQVMRIGGAIVAVLGFLILAERIAAPDVLGYVLLALGLADFFIVPTWLARKWSTRAR